LNQFNSGCVLPRKPAFKCNQMQPTGSFGFAQMLAGRRRTHLLYIAPSLRSTSYPENRGRVSAQLARFPCGSGHGDSERVST
jgi:hypothetical protein